MVDPTYRWDDYWNKTSEAIGGSMSGYGFSVGGSGFWEDDTYADVFSVSGNVILEETETMDADYLGLGTVVLEDSPQADLRCPSGKRV